MRFLCVWQDQMSSSTWWRLLPFGLWVWRQILIQRTATRTWCWMRRGERRVHFKFEKSSGCGAPAIQVAVHSSSCHPQRQTLRRVATPRPLALRPMHSEISSDTYFIFKTSWRANMKISAKFEKGVRRGRDYRLSRIRWHSEHSPNVGRVLVLGQCVVIKSYVTKDQRGGATILKTELWKHTHTFILHILDPMRLASEWYAVWYRPRK